MAISDKLQKILNSKAAIKEAINNKGGNVGDVLADYAPAINALSSGGVIDKALEDANYDVEDKLLAAINLSESVTKGITNYRDIAEEDKDKVIFLPVLPPVGYAFANMHNLLYLPNVDYSVSTSGTLFLRLCYNCYSLREVDLDCANRTSLSDMFYNCYSLRKVNLRNGDSVTSLNTSFLNCYSLENINLETPNVTNYHTTFYYCKMLKKITLPDTSKVTTFANTFRYCESLKEISEINATSCTDISGAFNNFTTLEIISFTPATINVNIDFSVQPNLTRESVLSILKGLNQVTSTKTLKLHTTTKALITTAQNNVTAGIADELDTNIAEQINGSASVTSVADRGWTIA